MYSNTLRELSFAGRPTSHSDRKHTPYRRKMFKKKKTKKDNSLDPTATEDDVKFVNPLSEDFDPTADEPKPKPKEKKHGAKTKDGKQIMEANRSGHNVVSNPRPPAPPSKFLGR